MYIAGGDTGWFRYDRHMGALAIPRLTPEAYLELDRRAEWKSEFHDGGMFPVEAATANHSSISINLAGLLWSALKGSQCRAFGAPFRLRVSDDKYVYPDFMLVCGKPLVMDSQNDTLINPQVVIEVLSPSTEDYNYGRKFKFYRSIPSVREYILVSQSEPGIDVYRRVGPHQWTLDTVKGLAAPVSVESTAITMSLSDVYEQAEFSI